MRRTAVGWDHVGQTRGKMGMGDRWRPEGVRTERGSERVEAGADGGGRMRRILVELETRLVFQERVQGGGGGQKTTGLNGLLLSFMRRAF